MPWLMLLVAIRTVHSPCLLRVERLLILMTLVLAHKLLEPLLLWSLVLTRLPLPMPTAVPMYCL